jgi:hypothetical protein
MAYPEGGLGVQPPPPQIIPKFWQSRAEFPVLWKIHIKNLIRIRVANWAEPLTRGLPPPIPVLSALCPQLNMLNPPPPKKISGYATAQVYFGYLSKRNLSRIAAEGPRYAVGTMSRDSHQRITILVAG